MLASSLASASSVLALPEMHFMHLLFRQELLGTLPKPERVVSRLLKEPKFMALGVASSRSDTQTLLGTTIAEMITNILERYNALNRQKVFDVWVEHTPHNHRYFEELRHYYPDAFFLHIVRDGRAVYSSTKETDWGCKDVVTGACWWRESVTECLVLARVHPSRVITVRYEDFTSDPEKVLKEICTFACITYTPRMLDNNGVVNPVFSKFQKKIGSRPNTGSHALWKQTLKPYEIAHFDAVNRDLLTLLGYETKAGTHELASPTRALVRLRGKVKMYFSMKKAKRRFNSVFEKG
jgi:hypothetical protein